MSDADSIGNRILHANGSKEGVLSVEQAGLIIYSALFETGPNRLSAHHAHVAKQGIFAALTEWKKQLESSKSAEADDWKKKYTDAKAQLDDVMLRYAILCKETGRTASIATDKG